MICIMFILLTFGCCNKINTGDSLKIELSDYFYPLTRPEEEDLMYYDNMQYNEDGEEIPNEVWNYVTSHYENYALYGLGFNISNKSNHYISEIIVNFTENFGTDMVISGNGDLLELTGLQAKSEGYGFLSIFVDTTKISEEQLLEIVKNLTLECNYIIVVEKPLPLSIFMSPDSLERKILIKSSIISKSYILE